MWVQRTYSIPDKLRAVNLTLMAVVLLYTTAAVSAVLYRWDNDQPGPVWISRDSETSVLLFHQSEDQITSSGVTCVKEKTIYTCVQAEFRR